MKAKASTPEIVRKRLRGVRDTALRAAETVLLAHFRRCIPAECRAGVLLAHFSDDFPERNSPEFVRRSPIRLEQGHGAPDFDPDSSPLLLGWVV